MNGRPSAQRLQLIAADETARRIVARLVLDDAGHRRAAPHLHRLVEDRVDRAGGVAHVVLADHARGIGEPVGEHRRGGIEQQARAFDRVAGDADDPRLLHLQIAVLVEILDAGHLAAVVMQDARDMGVIAHLEVAGRLAARDVGIGRRPLRAPFAALEAEAGLLAGHAVVVIGGVDRHVAGVDLLVAKRVGALFQHLEVVVAGQTRAAAGAGDAQLGLGLVVPGRHFGSVDRPVEQVRALDLAVGGQPLPFVVLKAQRGARPVDRGAADGLDDPGRQAGEVLGDAPVARGGARIEPGELAEAFPFVVDVILGQIAPARFEGHDA